MFLILKGLMEKLFRRNLENGEWPIITLLLDFFICIDSFKFHGVFFVYIIKIMKL